MQGMPVDLPALSAALDRSRRTLSMRRVAQVRFLNLGPRGFIPLLESCPLQGHRVGLRDNAATVARYVLQMGRRASHQVDHTTGRLVEFAKRQNAALALIPADVRKKCGFVGVPQFRARHVAVVLRPYVSLNTMLGTP